MKLSEFCFGKLVRRQDYRSVIAPVIKSSVDTEALAAIAAAKIEFQKSEYETGLGKFPVTKKPSSIGVFGDGVYLKRVNSIGSFVIQKEKITIPGLENGPGGTFVFGLPEIPREIFAWQVSFYRAVMQRFAGAEAYSSVLYDKEENTYILYIPTQEVTSGSVTYKMNGLRVEYPSDRYLEVMSCHSHNTMGAFYSSTDDNDEKADMLYMVVGNLDKQVPTFKIRARLAGKDAETNIGLSRIFSLTETEFSQLAGTWTDLHEESWLALVSSKSYTTYIPKAYAHPSTSDFWQGRHRSYGHGEDDDNLLNWNKHRHEGISGPVQLQNHTNLTFELANALRCLATKVQSGVKDQKIISNHVYAVLSAAEGTVVWDEFKNWVEILVEADAIDEEDGKTTKLASDDAPGDALEFEKANEVIVRSISEYDFFD